MSIERLSGNAVRLSLPLISYFETGFIAGGKTVVQESLSFPAFILGASPDAVFGITLATPTVNLLDTPAGIIKIPVLNVWRCLCATT
jgi:hypothetical protein